MGYLGARLFSFYYIWDLSTCQPVDLTSYKRQIVTVYYVYGYNFEENGERLSKTNGGDDLKKMS